MLKKLCLILCGVLFITDSFATTDIAANAESSTCDSGVLGTTEGDVNFDAKWQANNVPLIWHNNNTVMQGLAAASNTCEYDGALTIPANEPQRTGYTFAGWHVMPTQDASALTSLSNGSERWAIGTASATNNTKYCLHDTTTGSSSIWSCSNSAYSDLERHEWKVAYTSGTVKGTLYGAGYCSGKSGTISSGQWNTASSFSTYADLESNTSEKKHCWCQATGWMADGSDTLKALSSLSSVSSWVFRNGSSSAADCAYDCAAYCAGYALNFSAFRRALFTR